MSIYKYKPKPMTKTEFEALDIILTYNEVDEKAHYPIIYSYAVLFSSCSILLKRQCQYREFTKES